MSLLREIALTDTTPAARPSFDARNMTGADGLAEITLDDKVYTLRITKAGKLILTK
jgi:hemin uptake protein HemP